MATSSICKIEGCGKPSRQRGWCGMHYMRWYTHGDPSIVKREKGKQWRWLMEVAVPFSGDECLRWPFEVNWKGYGRVRRDGRRIAAHRAVCTEVYGPPPTDKHVAAHSCGNGHLGCVNPKHLRWATQAENIADKYVHGTISRGERNGNSKLDEQTVREVKRLLGTMTQRAIANRLGIREGAVHEIKIGKIWGWL